jgi:hypothetical protein
MVSKNFFILNIIGLPFIVFKISHCLWDCLIQSERVFGVNELKKSIRFWGGQNRHPFLCFLPSYTAARPLIAGRSFTAARCVSCRTRIRNQSFSAWGRAVNPLRAAFCGICAFMGDFSCPYLRALHPSHHPGDIYRGNLEKRADNFSSFHGSFPFFSHDEGRGYPLEARPMGGG